MQVIYVPLEHIDKRYTVHLDRDITKYLDDNKIKYRKIYPNIPTPDALKSGSFLDAEFTIRFKMAQLSEIARLYRNDKIQDGDVLFFSDIWFPGIESIAYMNYFSKKNVKIRGFLHAGSFTDTDFVRDMERWAKNFEDIIFDISDKIYVASNFIKNDVIKKRYVEKDKLEVTSLPIDEEGMKAYLNYNSYDFSKKEDIVIFSGRNVDEKQPWLFDELARRLKGKAKFINTLEVGYSKEEYYKLLNKAKCVVSYALQENFGYSVQEACYLGCLPVVPNRLVYPELYPEKLLYTTFDESVALVDKILKGDINYSKFHPTMLVKQSKPIEKWFGEFKKTL
jgi:glycosyltransferase involved in cell wall biosynthesis|tara:strand:+ start:310 stop:1320 length:1011 start_codon:yes stop_codon:yes gene_type:complete